MSWNACPPFSYLWGLRFLYDTNASGLAGFQISLGRFFADVRQGKWVESLKVEGLKVWICGFAVIRWGRHQSAVATTLVFKGCLRG